MSDLLTAALLEKYISLLRNAANDIEPLMPVAGRTIRLNNAGVEVEIVPGLKPLYSVIGMMVKDVRCLRGEEDSR